MRRVMLSQLKTVHQELRDAIAQLATLLQAPAPDAGAVAAARLALSKASGRRRALIDCTIMPALHDADPVSVRALAVLRQESAAARIASSEHIVRWTMARIAADWDGYRTASDRMRTEMQTAIDREAALLYPLLEAGAASAA
jgi:hypothetical protein